MYYSEVFKILNEANVRYLVVGGVAINLYGHPRSTFDLDITLALDEQNLLSAIKAIESLGYKPKLPVRATDFANSEIRKEWREKKNMFVFSFIRDERKFETIDLLFETPSDFEQYYSKKRTVFRIEISIPVIEISDLIELKKKANRKQDISDIEILTEILHRQ